MKTPIRISKIKIISIITLFSFFGCGFFIIQDKITSNKNTDASINKPNNVDKEIGEDGPDSAALHDVMMTKDPALGYPPTERLEVVRNLISNHTRDASDCVKWSERGPGNIGGRTRAIMFDPNDVTHKKVWAGGVSGGLWYTSDITDNSPAWTKIDDLWDHLSIGCIAFDPSHQNIYYAGTGEGYFNTDYSRGAGIWMSTQSGAAGTWNRMLSTSPANSGNTFLYTEKIVVNSLGDVFAGTKIGGVQKFPYNGSAWIPVLSSLTGPVADILGGGATIIPSNEIADLEIAADGTIFATTGIFQSGAVFRSTNNGLSWLWVSNSNNGSGFAINGTYMRTELACAPSNKDVIYAFVVEKLTSNPTPYGSLQGVYQSVDKGQHWVSKTMVAGGNIQAWYDVTAVVDPNNENIVYANSQYAGINAIYTSIDGCQSWYARSSDIITVFPNNYVHPDQQAFLFEPGSSSNMLVACDGGIYYTTNANCPVQNLSTFKNKNGSLDKVYRVTQFYSCAMHLWKITNANTATPSFTALVAPISNHLSYMSCIEIGATDQDLLITYSNYGLPSKVFVSSDGGFNWTPKNGNLDDLPVRWALFNPFNRKEVLLATEVGVWSCSNITVSTPSWGITVSTIQNSIPNARIDMLRYRASDNLVLAATHGRGLFSTDYFNHPNASFSIPPAGLCNNGMVGFIDQSNNNPTSWTWDFGDGSTSNVQNPVHYYQASGLYQVTLSVSNSFGCNSNTQPVLIHATGTCCATFSPASDISDAAFNSGIPITGNHNLISQTHNIIIHGGSNAVIDGAHLAIPKDYKITVEASATLTIQNNSWLFACGDMWQGIEIQNGGHVDVSSNSKIDDAIQALFSNSGGTFTTDHAIFDHNYESIHLENGNYQSCTIVGTKFLSSGSTPGFNQFNYGNIYRIPHNGERPLAHINLINAGGMNIGDIFSPDPNIFSYADKGIVAEQTSLYISGNNFYNFTYVNQTNSFAILISRAADLSIMGDFLGGGGLGNNFRNCNFGIAYTGCDQVACQYNDMENVGTGIFSILNGSVSPHYLSNNHIVNANSGISSVWNFHTRLMIENNFIITSPDPANIATVGISSGEFRGISTANLYVQGNYIKTYGNYGILLRDNSESTITNNQILMKAYDYPTESYGIRLEGCTKNWIDCNMIQGFVSPTYPLYYKNKRGISLSYTTETTVRNNTTDHTNSGFEFSGTCNQLYFYGNVMKFHDEGMVLGACLNGCATQVGGVIGDQITFTEDGVNYFTSGNRYEGQTGVGNFSVNGGATFSIASTPQTFDVFNLNPYIPLTNNYLFGPGASSIQPIVVLSPNPYLTPTYCQNIVVDDLTENGQHQVLEGEQIVLNGNSLSSNDEVMQYYLNKNLFEKLKKDYALVDSSIILHDFYDSTSLKTMGKLVDLKLAVEFIYNDSIGNYNTQVIQDRIDSASVLITYINPTNLIENNERRVYDVVLNHFAIPELVTIDTVAIFSISDIAVQCPYIGGPIVYVARALMMLIHPTLKFNDDNYCSSIPLRRANKKINATKHYGLFYPNPTNSTINLIYDLSNYGKGELILNDPSGKTIINLTLDVNVSYFKINVDNLASGIYTGRLIGDNKIIDEIRLVISK